MGVAHEPYIETIKSNVHKIAENFYQIPKAIDTFADIAFFLQAVEEFGTALQYLKKSTTHFEATDSSYYHMGFCHYFLRNFQEAIKNFSIYQQKNPEDIMVRGWISKTVEEIRQNEEQTKASQKRINATQ